MNMITDPNNPVMAVGDTVCGYTVTRKGGIDTIDAVFYELEHMGTGARHLHISRADMENTFSVAFKTVPEDSTGVAHILEHTALCGSARFPVRDPFFSMLKRSLSTFMNAFTASDWTMYPFSTENRKDFFNLMDVYLDAAFFPRLDALSFKQEGHRVELEDDPESDDGKKLVFKGVVYNEMKGAMSSPDQVMARSLMNALYPDTTYRNNSGGEPEVIPSLTHAQLKAFHRRHYHPSNAFFYTYGNLPLKAHLECIGDKVLDAFERTDPRTDVNAQPRWSDPRAAVYTYPFSRTEDAAKKHQVCVAWLVADIKDSFEVLVLTVLEQVLLGNAASPLRKALIDSNLGTALSDATGFDADNRDTMFACGLKDVRASDADAIRAIVMQVLEGLADKGVDPALTASAIHQLEFHRKEVTNTPYPYGIKLLMTFAGSWMHGGDPEHILKFDADLERLQVELDKGPLLEQRIRSYFLDNPHRVLFTLSPDPDMADEQARKETETLHTLYTAMDRTTLKTVEKDARTLRELQETQEDISSLPTLQLDDILPSVKKVAPSQVSDTAACYDQSTAGIFYFAAAAGISSVAVSHLPLIPFLSHAVSRVGTRHRDYTEMARRIDAYTGGIGLGVHAGIGFDGSGACVPFVSLNGKCLERNQDKLFDIIVELLVQCEFSDQTRLRNLLLEYRASLESMVVHNGHRLAMSLASRNFSIAGSLGESWHGVHQLRFIKDLTDDLSEAKLTALATDLTAIAKEIFSPDNLTLALIGGASAVEKGQRLTTGSRDLAKMACPLSASRGFAAPDVHLASDDTPREGWATATSVSFVASAFETVPMGHEDAPALAATAKLLRSLYLHREIREKGGAYGGFAVYNTESGMFSFGSYRDPHIASTLGVYERAAEFMRSGNYGEEDIKEAVLQVCSDIDKPDPPGPAARKAFYREILSLSDTARARFKAELLKLNRRRVTDAAEKYFGPDRRQAVAVISGEQALQAANEKLAGEPLTLRRV